MKKITTMMLLILMSGINVLLAQSKGDMYVGTMRGMSISQHSDVDGNTKHVDNPIITLHLAPGLHCFAADYFRIGLQMELTTQSQKDENNNTESSNCLCVGPICSYYFQIADKFYFTPEIGLFFAYTNYKWTENHVIHNSKENGFDVEIRPVMLEFRPTDHFGFSASLLGVGFAHLTSKDFPDEKSNQFVFNIGINPSIGLKYYF